MDSQFACPLCNHVSRSVRSYVNHSLLHSNEYRRIIKCPIVRCKRKLSSYTGLKAHMYRDHQERTSKSDAKFLTLSPYMKLQCKTLLCKKDCDGIKDLLKHLREHINDGTRVECPFNQCSKMFSKTTTFKSHISRYHKYQASKDLPTEMFHSSNPDRMSLEVPSTSNETYDTEGASDEEIQTTDELFLKNLALFYLKLTSKYLLPASVIQCIVDQFQNIHSLGFSYCLQNLTTSLMQLNIPEPKIEEILNGIKNSDIFSKCNSGPLRSNYSRNKFFKDKFNYVNPKCHYLGRNSQNKECSYQYIPLLETIKCLFKDESVYQEYTLTSKYEEQTHNDCYFRDITDGLAFKSNALFESYPNSLRLILYQDAFEVCNPLGSSRKKHKIIGVYLTLGNFRPHLRSVVDNTLLVLMCKEVDLKHFGHEKIFHELLEDLKELENNGIEIHNETVKGTLFCITGDNLGSHGIGGFTENFSTVEHFCRYCTITLTEFHNDPICVGTQRTVENYNASVTQLLRGHRDSSNVNGIKLNSAFNGLKYYHVCAPGLPPCLGHDIFEGVGDYDLALILKNLINVKGWLTYAELNQRINMFPYLGADAASKPSQVNVTGNRLGGQATQNWCLIRLLPIILFDVIRYEEDKVWQLFLLLHDIVEIVCAPKIKDSDIAYLAVLIDEYLEDRLSCFPNEKLRPKHHFLKHYPKLILQFGPLIRLWTLRFESKHCYFKRCVKSAQNFKNVCQTLSEKHQLLQAYKQASPYFQSVVEVTRSIPLIPDSYNPDIQKAMKMCQIGENTEVSLEVTIKGTQYKKGHYVVLGVCDNGLLFGEIQLMIVNPCTRVYFIVQEHKSHLSKSLHVYSLLQNLTPNSVQCIDSSKLGSYVPLNGYKKGKSLLIPLKHAISL